jgi:uncharacterized NAD(P)/FAD-binding protein YdhS
LLTIAIVGLGPWGICALERIVTTARSNPGLAPVTVHVVEPGLPGAGVYTLDQPDYLLLNNPCGQLSLYPFADGGPRPPYGLGLFEWALARGYRWVGDRCAIGSAGEPIQSHHFLPRRLMGEYLHWFYRTLRRAAPPGMRIVHHRTLAVDITPLGDSAELVRLANGRSVPADHVILTSGHTPNRPPRAGRGPMEVDPYPVWAYVERFGAGSRVAVSGMGLVAIDVVATLTIGRGGRFIERGGSLRYLPSGREPRIEMFSRSGLPFTAKPVTGVDRTEVYRPIICTPEALAALRERDGARRRVDARSELLPLLFAEMHARHWAQAAFTAGSLAQARQVRERLRRAWTAGRFEEEVAALASRFGRFDPQELLFGPPRRHASSEDYQRFVFDSLADDLREAEVPGGASPLKSATEVLRIFRDPMRSIVEQGGISLSSYIDFNTEIRSRIHRLVAGPPAVRCRQLLALMEAGVLSLPYGPSPKIGPADAAGGDRGRAQIVSLALQRPHRGQVDALIRGHLQEPRLHGSASPLLARLYRLGRLRQFHYGTVPVGSIDLTADSHPIARDGCPQRRLWVFGPLTEGIRHFTHYLPSPASRIRAFEEIGSCVAAILGETAVGGGDGREVAPLLVERVA